jgi:hypothetical protein
MVNLAKIRTAIERTNKSMFWVNCVLSICALLFLRGANTFWRWTTIADVSSIVTSGEQSTPKSLTLADVQKATTGKAIFRSSRTVQVKVVDELSFYTVTGVSLRGGEHSAYVRDTKQKKLFVKKAGESIGSYQITAIDEQGVHLTRGGENVLLAK